MNAAVKDLGVANVNVAAKDHVVVQNRLELQEPLGPQALLDHGDHEVFEEQMVRLGRRALPE
jgi:hypothetical protein